MMVATLTNRAVTAILVASANQNTSSGDMVRKFCAIKSGNYVLRNGFNGRSCGAAILRYVCLSWGQKATLGKARLMSALPPIADIGTQPRDVRFVPKGDKAQCSKKTIYSIGSSAMLRRPDGSAVQQSCPGRQGLRKDGSCALQHFPALGKIGPGTDNQGTFNL